MLLKNLWDAIVMVKTTFKDWNTTLWDKINTDDLMSRVKELQGQVKLMPKGMLSLILLFIVVANTIIVRLDIGVSTLTADLDVFLFIVVANTIIVRLDIGVST